MGTLKSVRIDADTSDPKVIQGIGDILREADATVCWRRFCGHTKWWPDTLIKKLTTAFPKVIFRVDFDGIDDGSHEEPTFYLGDLVVNSYWLFPRFPSKAGMKKGKAKEVAYFAKKEEQAAAERAEKEKQAEIELLQILQRKYSNENSCSG